MCRVHLPMMVLATMALGFAGCAANIEQQARTAASDHHREDTIRSSLRCAAEDIEVHQLAAMTHPPEYALGSIDPADIVRWSRAGELYHAACPGQGYWITLHCPADGPCRAVRDNFNDIICVETY